MDCTNIIGEKIKSLRTNQEISIQELAERAGLTVEQVRVALRKTSTFPRWLR